MAARKNLSKEELLADIRRVALDLDRTPRQDDYRLVGCVSVSTIQRHFGTWNAALEAAGLPPNETGSSPKIPLDEMDPEDLGLSPIGERA